MPALYGRMSIGCSLVPGSNTTYAHKTIPFMHAPFSLICCACLHLCTGHDVCVPFLPVSAATNHVSTLTDVPHIDMGGCHSTQVEPARCRARERFTVLVAVHFGEDTADGRRFLAAYLKKHFRRCTILFARSLREAVYRCSHQRIDVVFLSKVFATFDDLTGPEAAHLIRRAEPEHGKKPLNWLPTVIVMLEGVELSVLGSRAASYMSHHPRLQSDGSHDIDLCMWMLYMGYDDGQSLLADLRSCVGCGACFAGSRPAHLCPCMQKHSALHRRAAVAAALELAATQDVTHGSSGGDHQVAHAFWQDRDMVVLMLRRTHPEVDDRAANLGCANQFCRECMRTAARQNVLDTLMPLLIEVKPTLLEVDVSRVLSARIFDRRPLHPIGSIAPRHTTISPGHLTFMVRYIVESHSRNDRSEHLDEHMRGMMERLADVCSANPCAASHSSASAA